MRTLTVKFTASQVGKFEKQFRDSYKKETGEQFKGNVIQFITTGVIQRKKVPDITDVITLIKLGSMGGTEEQAYATLERWLENEENKERGIVGAFCDCCKELCRDLPVNKEFKEQCENLEETITNMQTALAEMSKLFEKITSLKDSVAKAENKELGVEKEDTQE